VARQCHANTGINAFLYTVLLIVTDGAHSAPLLELADVRCDAVGAGEITDMDATTKAIVDASILPLRCVKSEMCSRQEIDLLHNAMRVVL
jgi:hypothetical protein